MAEDAASLLMLEDELTCSICLSTFEHPVTTPCGHNFCHVCLDQIWQNNELVSLGFNCPQCRTHFHTKPELKKNTVLSNVVGAFTRRTKSVDNLLDLTEEVSKPKAAEVLCDMCRKTSACQTCLTCMASYCDEHVRPHRENPTFASHQLAEPLADLLERICPEHGRVMELFCITHGQCICVTCFPLKHNGCNTSTLEEQHGQKEVELKKLMNTLDGKIEKTKLIISQMKEQNFVLKEAASNRKRTLELEYQQIRNLIDKDEQEAKKAVDKELESGQSKLQLLMKKFDQNVDQMKGAKESIENLLKQKQNFKFFQARVDMPSAANFDPYTPKLSIDSNRVMICQKSILQTKEFFQKVFNEPVEKRALLLMQGGKVDSPSTPPVDIKPKIKKNDSKSNTKIKKDDSKSNKPQKKPPFNLPLTMQPPNQPGPFPTFGASNLMIDINSAVKRSDLLQYGTVLTLDTRTAHKRINLSENFTKATVSDVPASYPDGPARFSVCSQALCTKGFSCGRHYWEVKMSSNNFCGLGLAYNSIDRKGPTSRLGRNSQSWCIEWFNVKLSAWHNSSETVLENPNPSRVGILLDCEGGTVTFFKIADRAYPFHTFVCSFTEPVYPAFWIFSCGSSISLCNLTN